VGGLQESVIDFWLAVAEEVEEVELVAVAALENGLLLLLAVAALLLPVEPSGPQAARPVQMSAASASCARRGDATPRDIIVSLLHSPSGQAPVHRCRCRLFRPGVLPSARQR